MMQKLLANKHTTGAGIAYVIGKALSELGPLWFPDHANQLSHTGSWICGIAVLYGLGAAGDAGAAQPPPNPPKGN